MKILASKSALIVSLCLFSVFSFVRPTFAATHNPIELLPHSLTPLDDSPDGIAKIHGITLMEAEVCTSIDAHEPVGAGSHFAAETGKIWVFTKFSQKKAFENEIKHVYYFDGKKISTVPLSIKGNSFRTWSYKTISPKMVGDWKVEITNSDGEVFDTIEFRVTE